MQSSFIKINWTFVRSIRLYYITIDQRFFSEIQSSRVREYHEDPRLISRIHSRVHRERDCNKYIHKILKFSSKIPKFRSTLAGKSPAAMESVSQIHGRINETEGKLKSIRCIRTIPSRYIMYLLSGKQIRRITRGWRGKLDFLDQKISTINSPFPDNRSSPDKSEN